jgi:hypothetical protein
LEVTRDPVFGWCPTSLAGSTPTQYEETLRALERALSDGGHPVRLNSRWKALRDLRDRKTLRLAVMAGKGNGTPTVDHTVDRGARVPDGIQATVTRLSGRFGEVRMNGSSAASASSASRWAVLPLVATAVAAIGLPADPRLSRRGRSSTADMGPLAVRNLRRALSVSVRAVMFGPAPGSPPVPFSGCPYHRFGAARLFEHDPRWDRVDQTQLIRTR